MTKRPTATLLVPFCLLACSTKTAAVSERATAPTSARAERDLATAITHSGCFLLARADGSEAVAIRPDDCDRPTPPASTFKVPHALVALQTGVVTDVETKEVWDGTRYPHMPAWEGDHDLRSAIRESVVWFFQATAGRIGRERMQSWLETLRYGNADASSEITRFWLEGGSLELTGSEQLDFWQRLVRGELAIDQAHVDTVMQIIAGPITDWQGRLAEGASVPPSTATLHAKTGTALEETETITWWAGVVEGPSGQWIFVSRVISSGPYPGYSPAVAEGMAALAEAGVL